MQKLKTTGESLESESKNFSLGSSWNLYEKECIGNVFKATPQSA